VEELALRKLLPQNLPARTEENQEKLNAGLNIGRMHPVAYVSIET
jgi:hypothetical protein